MSDIVLGYGTGVKEKAGVGGKEREVGFQAEVPHGHNNKNHGVLSENNKGTIWLG